MKPICESELRQLVDDGGDYCVSLYMPTIVAGDQSRQNHIRFKKLVEAAEKSLLEKGMLLRDVRNFLEPASELLESSLFWEAMSRGLAVLVTQAGIRVWHLPEPCDELCVVGKQPYIVPLLHWATNRRRYYVLAISQNQVRLLAGTHLTLKEVPVPDLPANLHDALPQDQPEGLFQVHSGQPQLRGKESLVFHGQGGSVDVAKEKVKSFFRQVDRAVSGLLRLRQDPLIFAGVDYLFPIYQEVNTYPHLLHTHIAGNPDLLSLADLRDRALPIIETLVRDRQHRAIERYWDLVSHAQTANRVEDILVAAETGSIETLFISPTAGPMGTFDAVRGTVCVDEEPRHDSEDLVNLATIFTLRSGGCVEIVPPKSIRGAETTAAILRHPIQVGCNEGALSR